MTEGAIYLALGSNLGDRIDNLTSAVEHLSLRMKIKILSSIYETKPMYIEEQPLFLNAVLSASTSLTPFELLHFVKTVERQLGRQTSLRNAPRLIDIDILFYRDQVVNSPELTIPHPRIAERAFVLAPLAEIAPELLHPVLQKTVTDLLNKVEGKDEVKRISKLGINRKRSF